MYRKKVYGESRTNTCVLCGSLSTVKNAQGLPVCRHHVREEILLRCSCSSLLEVKQSRYGVFFTCMHCGTVSLSKGLEINNLPLRSIDDL